MKNKFIPWSEKLNQSIKLWGLYSLKNDTRMMQMMDLSIEAINQEIDFKLSREKVQAKNVLNRLEKEGYTDRLDVSMEISLFEYGIIRNPKTDKVIYYIPEIKKYDWTTITLEEVKEVLETATNGFYSFIGSTKETELNQLDNNYLTNIIHSLNSYSGAFNDSCTWDCNLMELLERGTQ